MMVISPLTNSIDMNREILMYLRTDSLKQCRLVSRSLCKIIDDQFVQFFGHVSTDEPKFTCMPRKIQELTISINRGGYISVPFLRLRSLKIIRNSDHGSFTLNSGIWDHLESFSYYRDLLSLPRSLHNQVVDVCVT